jgi:hypothetical protein
MSNDDDYIKACDKCGALGAVIVLTSGNTFGSTQWTDGRMFAPMLPLIPPYGKCPACNAVLYLPDLETVDRQPSTWYNEDIRRKAKNFNSIPLFAELDEREWLEFASGYSRRDSQTKELRLLTWWASNDRYRIGHVYSKSPCYGPSSEEDIESMRIENLNKLKDIIFDEYQNNLLMLAEINRELGDFDAALKLLSEPLDGPLSQASTIIRDAASSLDPAVKQIVW